MHKSADPSTFSLLRSFPQTLKCVSVRESHILLLIVLLAFGSYTFGLTDDLFPGGDNAHYLVLADALESGQGYRTISLIDAPYATERPPGFSVLLIPVMQLFGMNIIVAKIFVALWGALSIALVFAFFKREESTRHALIIAMLYATAPVVFMYSRRVYSTLPFVTISFAALISAEISAKKKSWRNIYVPITAMLCVGAFYVRTVGLALWLAVTLWSLAKKRWAHTVILALLVIPLVALWFHWTTQIEGMVTSGYLKQFLREGGLREIIRHLLSNMQEYSRLFTENIWYLFTKAPEHAGLIWKPLIYLKITTIIGTTIVLVVGFFDRLKRKPGLVELYLGVYTGVLLLWPHVIDRFIVPILPFLICYYLYGISKLWQTTSRWLGKSTTESVHWINYGVIGLIILSNCTHQIARIYQEQHFTALAPNIAALYDVATWTDANLPASAIVLTDKPNSFYVYASRQTVNLNADARINDRIFDQEVGYIVLNHSTETKPLLSAFESHAATPEKLYCSNVENICIYALSKH